MSMQKSLGLRVWLLGLVLAILVPLVGFSAFLIVEFSNNQTIAPEDRHDHHLYLINFALFFSAAAIMAGYRLSAFISRQVTALDQAADALGNGKPPSAEPSLIAELDHMAKTLNKISLRERRTRRALLNMAESQQQTKAQLQVARLDTLTGLPSRGLFFDKLDELRMLRSERRFALMFVDLDGFKGVNDTYGHERGDQVLVATAKILNSCVREAELVGRLGGDEFILCLTDDKGEIEKSTVDRANIILEKVAEIGFGVGCSIGIATWTDDCHDVSTVMHRADEAMYEAKRKGKGGYVYYSGDPLGTGSVWL